MRKTRRHAGGGAGWTARLRAGRKVRAPSLHTTLQGDGTAQLLCRDAAAQDQVCRILASELGVNCTPFTVPPTTSAPAAAPAANGKAAAAPAAATQQQELEALRLEVARKQREVAAAWRRLAAAEAE